MSSIKPKLATGNPKLAKSLIEGYSSFAAQSAMMLNSTARTQELLAEAGIMADALKNPMFFPVLMGESHPDLIGRFIVASLKLAQIVAQNPDINVLASSQKRELAKEFQALADELKSIAEALA